MSETRALTNYDAKLAEQAAAYAAQHQTSGGTFLSTRAGQLKFNDEAMPGNEAIVVIIDSINENTFYPNKWVEGDKSPPVCYAFGRGADEMMPHLESMEKAQEYFMPQNIDGAGNIGGCKGCPKNEWGSADTGRGKACQNRIRLTLLPAGQNTPRPKPSRDFDTELFSPDELAAMEIVYLKLPPTSTKFYAKYLSQLRAMHNLPAHGVVTRISLTPDEKDQYHVNFEMVEKLSHEALVVVMPRNEEAVNTPLQGYAPPQEDEKPSGSLKGLRR